MFEIGAGPRQESNLYLVHVLSFGRPLLVGRLQAGSRCSSHPLITAVTSNRRPDPEDSYDEPDGSGRGVGQRTSKPNILPVEMRPRDPAQEQRETTYEAR